MERDREGGGGACDQPSKNEGSRSQIAKRAPHTPTEKQRGCSHCFHLSTTSVIPLTREREETEERGQRGGKTKEREREACLCYTAWHTHTPHTDLIQMGELKGGENL